MQMQTNAGKWKTLCTISPIPFAYPVIFSLKPMLTVNNHASLLSASYTDSHGRQVNRLDHSPIYISTRTISQRIPSQNTEKQSTYILQFKPTVLIQRICRTQECHTDRTRPANHGPKNHHRSTSRHRPRLAAERGRAAHIYTHSDDAILHGGQLPL